MQLPWKILPKKSLLWLLGMVSLVFLCHFFHIVDFHELDAADLRFRLRGKQKADPKIVVVTIDDRSLGSLGKWPWPRSLYAAFLDVLMRFEPKQIFFDILFTEASQDPTEDAKLKAGLKRAGNVILPFYYYSEEPFEAFFPIESLREESNGTGYVNVEPDTDGRTRRVKTHLIAGDKVYYHPTILMASSDMSEKERFDWVKSIPQDKQNRMWLNYPGSMNAFQSISVAQVIQAAGMNKTEEMKGLFENNIVFLGHTATGTTDIKATPFSTQDPGVLVQASAMHTLLKKKFFRTLPEWVHLIILLVFALKVGITSQNMAPRKGLYFVFGAAFVYAVLNFLLFVFSRLILPLFVPMIVIFLSYAIMLFLKYMEARMHKEMMERELKAAAQIQERFLPQTRPPKGDLDTAFECRFIKGVGGDLYSWVKLGDGRYGITVGDVSGKGMPAAIYMAKSIADFHSIDKTHLTPGQVNEQLNKILCTNDTSGMFLTLVYVEVDLKTKKARYSSAGHEPLIMFRGKSKNAEVMTKAQGMPLGMFDIAEYETDEIPFEPGDAFLLMSDGVKELRNPKKEELGVERVKIALEEQCVKEKKAKSILEAVFKGMEKYQAGTPAHDDRTLVCIHFPNKGDS